MHGIHCPVLPTPPNARIVLQSETERAEADERPSDLGTRTYGVCGPDEQQQTTDDQLQHSRPYSATETQTETTHPNARRLAAARYYRQHYEHGLLANNTIRELGIGVYTRKASSKVVLERP